MSVNDDSDEQPRSANLKKHGQNELVPADGAVYLGNMGSADTLKAKIQSEFG